MVKFSKNWNNKLDCNVFTTIRKHTKEKEDYYQSQIGVYNNIYLGDKVHCIAKIFDIKVMTYSQLPSELLVLDTGIPSHSLIDITFSKFGIEQSDKVIVLLFIKQDISKNKGDGR